MAVTLSEHAALLPWAKIVGFDQETSGHVRKPSCSCIWLKCKPRSCSSVRPCTGCAHWSVWALICWHVFVLICARVAVHLDIPWGTIFFLLKILFWEIFAASQTCQDLPARQISCAGGIQPISHTTQMDVCISYASVVNLNFLHIHTRSGQHMGIISG